jgi:HTH-type transcriptional regulator, sugar sensing transcriptional regulator
MEHEKLLKQLGFSTNESKVYIAALECGLSSAAEIAEKAGLQRTTTYSVLKLLVEKGLVGKSEYHSKDRFLAQPPDRLVTLADELRHRIKAALPEFEAIHNHSEKKPKIVFYEGDHAIQNVYDDTLREKPHEILEWNTNEYFERFPKDHAYIAKRMELGIKARRMAGAGSAWHTKHRQYDRSELAETLIIPKDRFWPNIEVNIYGNKVAIMNYAENNSVIIESKAIADAMRQVYELSWVGGKTVEVK